MSFESDWVFLRSALPDLRDYILSSDIFWPTRPPARSPSGLPLPQLSIGSLLISLARLHASPMSPAQEKELAELEQGIMAVRSEWRANWAKKAAREFDSRLHLWQQYLRELRADPRQHSPFYAKEVRQRAILALLSAEQNEDVATAQAEPLQMLDQLLRGLTQPGSFLWEPEIASGFPAGPYWFLYVTFPK